MTLTTQKYRQNINVFGPTYSYACKEWAEAYVDLQEDKLLQIHIVIMSRNEVGRRVLELSRQLWRERGLIAPFDEFVLLEAKPGLRRLSPPPPTP